MSQEVAAQLDEQRMRLRLADVCRHYGQARPAGTMTVDERSTKTVRCVTCPPGPDPESGELSDPRPDAASVLSELPAADAVAPVELDLGQPGASAGREHERRQAYREARFSDVGKVDR